MIKPMIIPHQKIIREKYGNVKTCPLITHLAYEYFESIGRHFLQAEFILVCEQIKNGIKPDVENYDEFLK